MQLERTDIWHVRQSITQPTYKHNEAETRQNGRLYADWMFESVSSLNEIIFIFIHFLWFVLEGLNNNELAMAQIKDCHWISLQTRVLTLSLIEITQSLEKWLSVDLVTIGSIRDYLYILE